MRAVNLGLSLGRRYFSLNDLASAVNRRLHWRRKILLTPVETYLSLLYHDRDLAFKLTAREWVKEKGYPRSGGYSMIRCRIKHRRGGVIALRCLGFPSWPPGVPQAYEHSSYEENHPQDNVYSKAFLVHGRFMRKSFPDKHSPFSREPITYSRSVRL